MPRQLVCGEGCKPQDNRNYGNGSETYCNGQNTGYSAPWATGRSILQVGVRGQVPSLRAVVYMDLVPSPQGHHSKTQYPYEAGRGEQVRYKVVVPFVTLHGHSEVVPDLTHLTPMHPFQQTLHSPDDSMRPRCGVLTGAGPYQARQTSRLDFPRTRHKCKILVRTGIAAF
jgi:hypothetical protein